MRKEKRESDTPRRSNYARKMNMLHSNFAIYKASKDTRKKEPTMSKKKGRGAQKTYYESPLKHIKRSKKWESGQVHKRVTRSAKQAEKQSSTRFAAKTDFYLNDSVIILSDNECETSGQKGSGNSKRPTKNNKKTVSSNKSDKSSATSTEPLRTLPCKSVNGKNSKVNLCAIKKKKRKLDPVVDPDISCLILSDTEDIEVTVATPHANGENIAPLPGTENQTLDDIEVVWSSTSNAQSQSENLTQIDDESNDEPEVNPRLFMIDYTPNKKNLNCLEPSQKKRKVTRAEKIESWESDLPFSKPGLKLPDLCEMNNENENQNTGLETNCAQNSNRRPLNPPGTTINLTANSVINTTGNSITTITSAISSDTTTTTVSSTSLTGSCNTTSCLQQRIPGNLREIIIDGNNVAMAHTKGKAFSEHGLKLVIDYFKWRGHTVKAFVPQHRRSLAHPMLEKWYTQGIVVFTPSRNIGGRRITPYDDRFILEYATMCGGIVVSMDQYRDLYMEKPEWRDTIANRLLVPTFVGDYIMFPEDPLGRKGPRLDEFLRY